MIDPAAVQISSSPTPGMVTVSGYVTDFADRDMYGGPEHGGWRRRIDRDVFEKAVDSNPDVRLTIDQYGPPLATTRTGNLRLFVDDTGLQVQAQVHAGAASHIRGGRFSGDGDFFKVKKYEWDDAIENVVIHEISLHKCEISITTRAR